MKDTKLYKTIVSKENLYKAIYALESYISERNLLKSEDLEQLMQLRDKFDFKNISNIITECMNKLEFILNSKNELFDVQVYFKLKKLKSDKFHKETITYRPLHTASLIDQICMAALLIPLMYDDTNGTRNLSELSRMIPHNFFGNIPSKNVEHLFINWSEKYRQYSKVINDKGRQYAKTREYDKEITFDLKDFFPSIDPSRILNYIWVKLSSKYKTDEEQKCLKTVITKLLYFRIKEQNLDNWLDVYYPNMSISAKDGYYISRGIAQGLPQSYFFGNLCMIDVAEKMKATNGLDNSDSYFYVDDSVVFTKSIEESNFPNLIEELNSNVIESPYEKLEPLLPEETIKAISSITYGVSFHKEGKSSICDIEDSFNGLEHLFLVQRPVSMGGWLQGNIDEVDDNVALKKLTALQQAVDNEINNIKENKEKQHANKPEWGETRLKWLRRYKRYFLFRERKLQLNINGGLDKQLCENFRTTFKFDEVIKTTGILSEKLVKSIFENFEEEIFKTEIELIGNEMLDSQKHKFFDEVREFEKKLTEYNCDKNRTKEFLYYNRLTKTLENVSCIFPTGYEGLIKIVRRHRPFRVPSKFIEAVASFGDSDSYSSWNRFPFLATYNPDNHLKNSEDNKRYFPLWSKFIFDNSTDFKRRILNTCFSLSCDIIPGDNLAILKTDIKPVRYFELRLLSMLRNRRFNLQDFCEFSRTFTTTDLNENMEIDLGLLEALGIFRQRVQDPHKIDSLIQTHRLVKSLWHNGSKFLNAYTLHNQEHAINLIKNVIRLINNIDFLNLKANDFFLLFQACYLHDISMVIHPDVASFNASSHEAECLIGKWLKYSVEISRDLDKAFVETKFSLDAIHKLRKKVGLYLIESFQNVFDFFENKVRSTHPNDSAQYIRQWQSKMLKFLTETEADTVATVSHSHGWNTNDVYTLKSAAKDELVSLKYMMILIRLADLLDLANDRIDYYLLRENRSQMGLVSRYHWISHLITDKYELDVDYEVNEKVKLSKHPIKEIIHLDIYLNTEILARMKVHKNPCKNICGNLIMRKTERYPKNGEEYKCIEYTLQNGEYMCDSALCSIEGKEERTCPFLCIWMSERYKWLFSEFGKLKSYLNAVNSPLISSEILVRFFYSNTSTLDQEFYDDIKTFIIK